MNRAMMRASVFFSFVLLLFLGVSTLAFSAARESKIACVDISRIFDAYQYTIDAEAELEKSKEEAQKKVNEKLEDIKKIQDKLDALPESKREEQQRIFDEKLAALKTESKDVSRKLVETRNEKVKEILKEIQTFIEEYAAANDYDFILRKRMVIYENDKFDLSEDIIEQLNKKYKKAKK